MGTVTSCHCVLFIIIVKLSGIFLIFILIVIRNMVIGIVSMNLNVWKAIDCVIG